MALVASFGLWLLVFAVPFLPGEPERRIASAVGLYALSYLAFFVGGLLLGKPAMARARARLGALLGRRTQSRVARPSHHQVE